MIEQKRQRKKALPFLTLFVTIWNLISIPLAPHPDVASRYMKFQKNPNNNIGLDDLVVISKPGLAVVSDKITD